MILWTALSEVEIMDHVRGTPQDHFVEHLSLRSGSIKPRYKCAYIPEESLYSHVSQTSSSYANLRGFWPPILNHILVRTIIIKFGVHWRQSPHLFWESRYKDFPYDFKGISFRVDEQQTWSESNFGLGINLTVRFSWFFSLSSTPWLMAPLATVHFTFWNSAKTSLIFVWTCALSLVNSSFNISCRESLSIKAQVRALKQKLNLIENLTVSNKAMLCKMTQQSSQNRACLISSPLVYVSRLSTSLLHFLRTNAELWF